MLTFRGPPTPPYEGKPPGDHANDGPDDAFAEHRHTAPAVGPHPPRQTPAPRRSSRRAGAASRRTAPTGSPTPASAERRTPATKPQPRQQQGLRSKQPQTRLDDFDRITRQRQREIAERQAKLQAVAREASERGESTVRPMLTTLRSEHDVTAVDATEATTSGAELLANLSADDWRRGIVMAEILGKPICERSDQRLF